MSLASEAFEFDPVPDDQRPALVLCTAELAECTCPEFCERDHDNE